MVVPRNSAQNLPTGQNYGPDTIQECRAYLKEFPNGEFAEQSAKRLDDLVFQEATEPFSINKINDYLNEFPKGEHAAVAKEIVEDEASMDDIRANGVGVRFVFPDSELPLDINHARSENHQRGRIAYRKRENYSSVEIIFGTILVIQDGFVHNIKGKSEITGPGAGLDERPILVPCGDRSVFVYDGNYRRIDGEHANPLRFGYLKEIGLVYLNGHGKVLSKEDKMLFDSHEKP